MNQSVGNPQKGGIIAFAERDILTLLKRAGAGGVISAANFSWKIDNQIPDGSFIYNIYKDAGKLKLYFQGSDSISATHAAYSLLEHLGFRFNINATQYPSNLRTDTLTPGTYTIHPYTRWRGIRQHVNFPMDISAYSMKDAQAYLENLLRMRFNKIAIHSYPNLWHEVKTGDSTEFAGHFFYNRPHEIPNHPTIRKNIRDNKKWFSIPEIEPVYEDRIARSHAAVKWMQEFLRYAKSLGMRIQFSIEPRQRGEMSYILDNARSALDNYPMIDDLEIITEETGGWGNGCTDTAVKEIMIRHFGENVLKDPIVMNAIQKTQTDLDNLADQLGRNIQAVSKLKKEQAFQSGRKKLALGIYCTMPQYVNLAYHLVRKYAPDTEVTLMPGHGSRRTAAHLNLIRKSPADLKQTTIYSWIEFDGLMFTQQNAVAGIESMFVQLDSIRDKKQLHAVLFNHWRTSENAVSARYAAISSMHGPLTAAEFYHNEAKAIQIARPEEYVKAMRLLEEIDYFSTEQLPNIGFCWIGAWLQGMPYLRMDPLKIQKGIALYDSMLTMIQWQEASTKEKAGKKELEFLSNRLKASISYLNAFLIATELQKLKSADSDTTNYKIKAAAICNAALMEYERYMKIHTEQMPDRGCEGTLINLWHGPMYGLKVLRYKLAGIPMEVPPQSEKVSDGPPLPIVDKLNQ